MAQLNATTTLGGNQAATLIDLQNNIPSFVVATGSGNAYEGAFTPAITTLVAGLTLKFQAHHANTGAVTFNPDGLGAKTVKKLGNSTDLEADDILNSQIVTVTYDGTYFQMTTGAGGSTASGDKIEVEIAQATHGFDVGNTLYFDPADDLYKLGDCSTIPKAEIVGIVSDDISSSTFMLLLGGYITGLSGLTKGSTHFQSATPGALTATEPTTEGHVSKPLLFADSTTSGYFFNMRGAVVGGAANLVSNVAYDATSWDGVTTIAPSKNAVRDKIESMAPSILTAKTSSGSVSATELGGNYILTNTGAGDAIELTLPAGVAGYSVEVIVTVAQYLKLTADGTEKFRYGTSEGAAGGYIRDNVIGTHFKITWSGANWNVQIIAGSVSYDQ